MLLHTVVFDKHCNAVIFQTNIHNGDDVNKLLSDIESGQFSHKLNQVMLDKFNSCYKEELTNELSLDEIKTNLSKLSFETDVQHLKEGNNNFEPIAREKIYEFSEIDLERYELKEILLKLLDLVEKKSSGVIKCLTSESIEKHAGISIDDLLSILSISKDAYNSLLKGGDRKAIKSASIIQRTLIKAGASMDSVEYCSRCKIEWDIWLRNNRHIISEFDLNAITQEVKLLLINSITNDNLVSFSALRNPIKKLLQELEKQELLFDLTENLILGGVFSELVRRKA